MDLICGVAVSNYLCCKRHNTGFYTETVFNELCLLVFLMPSNESPHSVFQDPHAEEFEDKEWTFVIENVSAVMFLCFW